MRKESKAMLLFTAFLYALIAGGYIVAMTVFVTAILEALK